MLKKRLIFSLLVQNERFMLSRNFSLQSVGDINWLREHYEFESIAFSIDELIILEVSRGPKSIEGLCSSVAEIGRNAFMPIAAGGGIRSINDAHALLQSGADKVVVNTALFTNPSLMHDLVVRFGSQCIIASIDYKRSNGCGEVFVENGMRSTGMSVRSAVALAQELGVGEIYLTSISRDGTGQGLDVDFVSSICDDISLPIIISGGAGSFRHLGDALQSGSISAVSTANLFNFMGDNLTEARRCIIESGIPLATWDKLESISRDKSN